MGKKNDHIVFLRMKLLLFLLFYAVFIFGINAQQHQQAMHITIASEPDYPPYCFVDENGQAAGFSVELFKAAASAMNIEVEIKVGLWNEIKRDLAEGTIDALPLVGRTPEREEDFDFTIPYLSLYGGIVVRADNTDIEDLDDLRGKRVAVMKGDNAEEFLRRTKRDFEIITTPTFSDAMRLVSEGTCDAVVIQRLVGFRIIQEQGVTDLKVLDNPIYEFRQDFCFAVRDGDKDLLALLNEGLALVMANGTFRRLQTRWFAALELPSRKIIVGGDHNYPPFEFLDERGRPSGYNTELTRAIARELGIDVEIVLGPWSKIRDMLERGEIDVIQGMLYSAERDKKYDFSQPHTVNHCVAVSRGGEDGTLPSSAEELAGKRIVVQDGDIMHDFALESDLDEHFAAVDTQEEALRQLASGLHDYALTARLTALHLIEQNEWENLVVGKKPFFSHEYCYAVKENRKALIAHFSEGLAVLEDTGGYRKIYDKWLGVYEPLPPSFTEVFRYVAMGAGPLLAILAVFLLWTRSLRSQVARRTQALGESEKKYRLLAENTLDVIWLTSPDMQFVYVNPSIERLTGHTPEEWVGTNLRDHCDEENYKVMTGLIQKAAGMLPKNPGITFEAEMLTKNGHPIPVEITGKALLDENGEIAGLQGVTRDITERKKAEEELKKIEWMLQPAPPAEEETQEKNEPYVHPYGDLVLLNSEGVILKAVGRETLEDIVREYLDLLDTSAAVYEMSGDYALGIFSSGWCRFLDNASRKLCGTDDNRAALAGGKWLCHDSCWKQASKVSIENGRAVDVECEGGIHMYAVPVRAGNDIVGSINVGYGDPPRDESKLLELAAKYGVDVDELRRYAKEYATRPLFIIELAKRRLHSSARLIGEIVERRRAESELQKLKDQLEEQVEEKTKELRERISELERFHDATIDRELRVKELRDEIEILKREIRGEA